MFECIHGFADPPEKPNITAVYSDNPAQLTVTWSPASSGSPATSFNVSIGYVADKILHTDSIDADGRSYTFTGLISATTYIISVVAINCAGSNNSASQAKGRTGEPWTVRVGDVVCLFVAFDEEYTWGLR